MLSKLIKVSILTLLAYLLQATLAIHISLWDVAPNIALSIVSIITIALGRKYTFLMSLSIGYLLEILLPTMDYLNLILYPVVAMLGALAFSDKSERRLEEERTTGKRTRTLSPHIRTPLCAMLSMLVFESVHLIYIFLNGYDLEAPHFFRTLVSILYSGFIAGILQFPIRWWFGIYKLHKAR